MKSMIHKMAWAGLAASISLFPSFLQAQGNGPHHSEPVLIPASPSGYDMTWFGEVNTAYFVEFSTDLTSWEYLPFTHRGEGLQVPFWYECQNQSTSMFLRIKWLANAPLGDADGDGVSYVYEVNVLGSDPLTHESWVI